MKLLKHHLFQRSLRRWRKNMTVMLILVALHFILLIYGFSYVKRSLLREYRESSSNIRQLKIKYELDVEIQERNRKSPEIHQEEAFLKTGKSKTILLWNMPESVSYPKSLHENRCGKCDITIDKARTKDSDAIVLHYLRMKRISDLPLPETRNQDQVYVWTCRESPNTTMEIYQRNMTQFDNVINWTMTHRLDSDVFYPYAEILHRLHDEKNPKIGDDSVLPAGYVDLFYQSVDEVMAKKQHLAAWIVGNCGGTKGAKARMRLTELLSMAGLDIHKFGRCFKWRDFPSYRSEEAHAELIKYKFYLAFENTFQCRDYVTYKFWKNSIYSGTVPIVWGPAKSDLKRLAPDHSFIHVEDFPTLESLVKYVNYLDSNDTAYREYFNWREREIATKSFTKSDNSDWIFSLSESFGYCKLCQRLHGNLTRKSIPSLSEWWYGKEREECVTSVANP